MKNTSLLNENVAKLALNSIKQHLFLCCDQTKPKCCSKDLSLKSWQYLKTRLKELGLEQPTESRPYCVFRTKANCLRVCSDGPILLIYPEGIWYRNATPEVIEKVIQEHLLQGKIVAEYVFHQHQLPLFDETKNTK
jgi:(2Fe-2S) ferredoxin